MGANNTKTTAAEKRKATMAQNRIEEQKKEWFLATATLDELLELLTRKVNALVFIGVQNGNSERVVWAKRGKSFSMVLAQNHLNAHNFVTHRNTLCNQLSPYRGLGEIVHAIGDRLTFGALVVVTHEGTVYCEAAGPSNSFGTLLATFNDRVKSTECEEEDDDDEVESWKGGVR